MLFKYVSRLGFSTKTEASNPKCTYPVNTVIEKTVTARPRVRLLNMSENTAATTARGHEPKTPPKNRQIRTVCRSFPTALPIEKMEKPNMAIVNGSFLPFSSDSGAHKIGPQANPRT